MNVEHSVPSGYVTLRVKLCEFCGKQFLHEKEEPSRLCKPCTLKAISNDIDPAQVPGADHQEYREFLKTENLHCHLPLIENKRPTAHTGSPTLTERPKRYHIRFPFIAPGAANDWRPKLNAAFEQRPLTSRQIVEVTGTDERKVLGLVRRAGYQLVRVGKVALDGKGRCMGLYQRRETFEA